MPTNKNITLRYQILDRCFSDIKDKYTFKRLLNIVNENLYNHYGESVSVRSLWNDIEFFRSDAGFKAPLKTYRFKGNECYYRYEDATFSIYKTPLTINEINNLKATIEMLNKYRGIPANAWLEEVISSLELKFGLKSNKEDLISFSQNDQLKGVEYLSDVIDFTLNHQAVDLRYVSFKGKTIETTFHPYYVKQYNQRWFLLGVKDKDKDNEVTVLALDRIDYIYRSNTPFKENTTIDFSTYFDDFIGVSKPGDDVQKERYLLQFTKDRFPYVETKPIHHSQKNIDKENGIIELNLRRNKELDQQIFSYLPDITILEPKWYKNEIIEKIQQNLKNYRS